jgi:hypothetical protein
MAVKLIPDATLDLQLDQLEGTNIHVCEEPQPTTWAAIAAVELASQAIVGTYTKANGDTSGRKTTCPAQSGANTLSITKSGDATSIVISDGSANLICSTTCTQQTLTSGGTVDVPAWDAEIGDPT